MRGFNPEKYRLFKEWKSPVRFFLKIDKSGSTPESQAAMLGQIPKVDTSRVTTPCHLWEGHIKLSGSGSFPWAKNGFAFNCESHVLAYYLSKNDLPQERGLVLDHLCRVRHCCNPDHLEVVTSALNAQRGNHSKLESLDIVVIHVRREQGWSFGRIAKELNISRGGVSDILQGNTWSDVHQIILSEQEARSRLC